MRPVAIFYAVLTLLGLVVPYRLFVGWVRVNGLDWGLFLEQATVNDIATFIALDATMGGIAATAFVCVEGWRLRMRAAAVVAPVTLLVGGCFGLPLFLLLRELRKPVQ